MPELTDPGQWLQQKGLTDPGVWLQQKQPSPSLTDALQHQGFLDSAWSSIKGAFSTIGSAFSGEYSKDTRDQLQRAKELEKSGTPEERRNFAQEVLLKNIPLAATIYKATHGNIPGALGDVTGLAAIPVAAKGVSMLPKAAGVIADVARAPGTAKLIKGTGEVTAGVGTVAAGHPIIGAGVVARGIGTIGEGLAQRRAGLATTAEAGAPGAVAVTPGAALARAQGVDWEQLSPESRTMFEQYAQGQASAPAQAPRPPAGPAQTPPQAAPSATPAKPLDQQVAEYLASRNGKPASPPAAAPAPTPQAKAAPAPAPDLKLKPGEVVYTGDQPAVMRSPQAAQYAGQLAEEMQRNGAAAPAAAPGAPEASPAQAIATNRTAKAQRFADALAKSGIDAKGAGKIEQGYVSQGQMQQGMTPRWGNIAEAIGEKEPSMDTVGEIVRQMRNGKAATNGTANPAPVAAEPQPAPAAEAPAARKPSGTAADIAKGDTLYRGAPSPELGKGNYPGTFLSTRPDATAEVAKEYGDVPVHQYTAAKPLKLFDAAKASAKTPLVDQYLSKYPEERQYLGAGQDRQGEFGGLFEQPGEELVGFLRGKGYDGMRYGNDVFVFDNGALRLKSHQH